MSDDTRDRLRELEGDVEEFASGHAMHRRTGEVTDDDPLVCLLYLLARDELPVGTLEALIEDPNWRASHFAYCNGYLARWAQDAATRVRGDAEDDGRGEGASDSNAMGREWLPGDPQLTTEEAVQNRMRQFFQERVDHHRKMAGAMNEPFRSDHQKLARAYEARLEEVGGE